VSTSVHDDNEARIAALNRAHPTETVNAAVLDQKLRRRGRVLHAVRQTDDVAAQLEKFLSGEIDGPFTVANLGRLAGGASKEQFAFDLTREGPDGARTERLVLRLNPPASVVETSRRREFEVLQALHGLLPVPQPHWVIADYEPFGEHAIICGFVSGVAAPTTGGGGPSGLGTAYGEYAGPLGEQFVDYLATLHALDVDTLELPSFDRPRIGTTDAADWRVALWDRVWAEDTYEAHPTITLTREWLWANRPPLDKVSLVHGDYRNGNFLFHESDLRITSILDWELAYLGDRHHDLAYLMLIGWGHDDASGKYLCSGLIDADSLIARYEAASGLSVDPVRLRYYTVLNMYWAMVACSATATRVAQEQMTHLDVMMPFVTGLGMFLANELNKILGEDAAL
jgi:aminoglycoside phosphotransferase (APT) family kinase protein